MQFSKILLIVALVPATFAFTLEAVNAGGTIVPRDQACPTGTTFRGLDPASGGKLCA